MNATVTVQRKCQCGAVVSVQTVDVDEHALTYLAVSADDVTRVYSRQGRPEHDVLRPYSGQVAFRGACRNDN